MCPRCLCPLTCGGDEEPGASLSRLPGPLRTANVRRESEALAPRPLRAVEDVSEVREHPGPGERPLHGVRVRSPRQHHSICSGPR